MIVPLRFGTMVVILALGLFAQTSKKPDFSGTWELDLQRTRFGKMPRPKSLVIQIEHREPQIRVVTVTTTDKGEARETLDLTTDGKQQTQLIEGQECAANAHWDRWSGTRLFVDVNCMGSSRSRRLTVGSKGRMLTTVLAVAGGAGQGKAYEFFLRK